MLSFSDGSEAEILADPVEQAQEDAGNDMTETPEVGITFTEPKAGRQIRQPSKIQVEDTKNTGAFFYCKSRSKTFRKWRMVRHNRKYGSIHLF